MVPVGSVSWHSLSSSSSLVFFFVTILVVFRRWVEMMGEETSLRSLWGQSGVVFVQDSQPCPAAMFGLHKPYLNMRQKMKAELEESGADYNFQHLVIVNYYLKTKVSFSRSNDSNTNKYGKRGGGVRLGMGASSSRIGAIVLEWMHSPGT